MVNKDLAALPTRYSLFLGCSEFFNELVDVEGGYSFFSYNCLVTLYFLVIHPCQSGYSYWSTSFRPLLQKIYIISKELDRDGTTTTNFLTVDAPFKRKGWSYGCHCFHYSGCSLCTCTYTIAHVAREVPVAGEELPDIPVVNASPLGNPLNEK